jgi:hypothetical protein
MHKKDLAKFFSGVAVAKVGCHAALAASNILPITLLGCTISSNCNFWMLVIWAVIAVFLIHYAWFKK